MKFKTLLLTSTFLSSLSFGLNIEVGVGPQQEQFRGWIQYKGTSVDLKNDLHLQDKTRGFGYVIVRHKAKLWFIPLPDLRFEFLKIDTSGTGTLSKDITVGGITFTVSDRISTKVRFDQYDVTFFYTPLKVSLAKFSWGLGVKTIDFYYKVRSLTTGKESSKSATLPLPYLYGRTDFYFLFLRAFGEIRVLPGSSYFYDAKAGGGVSFSIAPRLELFAHAGYRYQRYRVKDISDISSDIKIKGLFGQVGLSLSF